MVPERMKHSGGEPHVPLLSTTVGQLLINNMFATFCGHFRHHHLSTFVHVLLHCMHPNTTARDF